MISPGRLRVLTLRMSYAIETAAQFNHATSRKIRRGFARYLLGELRSMHTELAQLHKEAWSEDLDDDVDPRTKRPQDPMGLVGPTDSESIGYPYCPWCRAHLHYGPCVETEAQRAEVVAKKRARK